MTINQSWPYFFEPLKLTYDKNTFVPFVYELSEVERERIRAIIREEIDAALHPAHKGPSIAMSTVIEGKLYEGTLYLDTSEQDEEEEDEIDDGNHEEDEN